ncbi:MAG: hypothetical protein KKG75_05430 [Nanoarchaeota archaeon]|nr:hypothetical protein [Nanoarchaeota archaeon]
MFVPVADVECRMDTGMSEDQYLYWAADNLLDWGANGVNLDAAHVYLQSEERRVNDLAYAVARGLDFELAADTYGFEKLCGDPDKEGDKGEFPFLFAGITQVGDILLAQHPDFGNYHSFMVSGQDQDGHMKMTNELVRRMFEAGRNIYDIHTNPSGLYVPHIRGFKSKKPGEAPKMSSSWAPGTLYLGSGHDNENINERIKSSLGKFDPSRLVRRDMENCALDLVRFIDSFNEKSIVDFAEIYDSPHYKFILDKLECATREERSGVQEAIDAYLTNVCKREGQDNVELVRESLGETLRNHQIKRQEVLDYAITRANLPPRQGWDEDFTLDPPEFWEVPERAVVNSDRRNKTEWFNIVEKAREKLIA